MTKPLPISKQMIQHRLATKHFSTTDAVLGYREPLQRLHIQWDEFNRRFFAGQMVPPYISLGTPSYPRAWGTYTPTSSFGGRAQIDLRQSMLEGTHRLVKPDTENDEALNDQLREGRMRVVEDILLHETVHQFQHEISGNLEDSYKGHGPGFAGVCNQIGAELGLAPVRPAKARGPNQSLPSCANWPHCVRPAAYYMGVLLIDYSNEPPNQEESQHLATDETLNRSMAALQNLVIALKGYAGNWPRGSETEAFEYLMALLRANSVEPVEQMPASDQVRWLDLLRLAQEAGDRLLFP